VLDIRAFVADRGCDGGTWLPDKLVYMASHIGKLFAGQGGDKAVPLIADHLIKFGDPRMCKAIAAHLAAGSSGLDPTV
jgi:formate dehydrogenase subunit delta